MRHREVIRAVAPHPSLWVEAVAASLAMAPDGGWRRGRLLPEPDYAAWRTATAYGDRDAAIAADDVIAYLRWRREQRKGRSPRGGRGGRHAT